MAKQKAVIDRQHIPVTAHVFRTDYYKPGDTIKKREKNLLRSIRRDKTY